MARSAIPAHPAGIFADVALYDVHCDAHGIMV
jgi:hypothetical protein